MNPSRLFILRPVATSLLMIALLLAGILGYRQLPVSSLPEVDFPTIQVVTLYPGASPDVITSTVTAPLERQFGQMPGLKQMSSQNSGGASVIVLQFDLDLSLDIAEQEVQAAINAATSLLPQDLPTPPVYSKVNPADAPIMTLAATSATLPLPRVQDLADARLAQKLSQLPGVGLVTLAGGQRPAVRIRADPQALAARGMSLDDVRTAIGNANVNQAKGSFDGSLRASTIDANDQLQSAEEYGRLVIAYRNGAPIRLADVAQVVDGAENTQLAAWANDKAAIIVNVQRQPGANVIDVVNGIRQLLPQLQASLPAAVEVQVLADRAQAIRASVRDVGIELVLAIALVVLVVFLFLRSARSSLIPAVAVPLSLIGTFAVVYLAGFSVNNLTLMALTIASGFVVDDAIVMIENISRHVEAGEKPLAAAITGAGQIGFTIISLTVSLIAVLIPLLFMGDVVGRLFREFAVTLAVAIVISAAVSLTLTPMMCSRLLRAMPKEAPPNDTARRPTMFDALTARYATALDWVLKHQTATLITVGLTLAMCVLLYLFVPKGFFPVQDTGMIQGITEAAGSVSFPAMAERQQTIARAVLKDPAVAGLSSFIGVDGTNATLNSGRILITLKPLAERRVSASEVIRRLQPALAQVTGVSLYLQPVQDLTIESRASRTQYQLTMDDPNPDELSSVVPRFVDRLRQSPMLADVASDLQDAGLQTRIEIDRDAAARVGLTIATIDNALYNAFGQRLISTIYTQANQYRVVLEAATPPQGGRAVLDSLYLKSPTGQQVPLNTVARVTDRSAPLAINHLGQFPSATVSFNPATGVSLSEAVDAIQKIRNGMRLPASIHSTFQGAALAFQSSLNNTLLLILGAVVTMYIVLGILYESFIHPVTILSTLPSATVGALLALVIVKSPLDIIAVIGIILLIGLVKKNAIMMIDFALSAEREGMPAHDAIRQACLLRLRPILMTTMAALLGALPLMLGTGAGSELRHPLGLTMVGGLIFSQILTLFTTPVIYLAFDRLARRARFRTAGAAGAERGLNQDPDPP